MCLAHIPQRSDAGEAQTRGLLVPSQALYHLATALPFYGAVVKKSKIIHFNSVVECLTRDGGTAGLSLTGGTALCP